MADDAVALKIGRLEDKFTLYEPMFKTLHGIASIPTEINKIQGDLETLKESRVAVREQLVTLFKAQDRVYRDMVRSLEKQTQLLEKGIEDCPIGSVDDRLVIVERDIGTVATLDERLETAEKVIDSFKLKGWDLLFRITPWVIAAGATSWAVLRP